ncbi:crossover junction endodeoxyribonuclease RuvC [Sporosarcina psychrophila]|uniref:Crossover junction endodeoxyribonuclease RuvC n=1 Tax=Sporosarcina psychrophila TaxID=1476 RepID=A0ABV2KES8_SPOPS
MTSVLAFDTSLSSPGAAIVTVSSRGKPVITAMSHVKPDGKSPYALRADIVESWATLFIADNTPAGATADFTYVVREDFHGMSSAQNYPVFAAWTGTEFAAHKFGLAFDKHVTTTKAGRKKTTHGMSQSAIKLAVVGKGTASKDEVADAVRRWTGYTGEFATDDCSDAVAVGLAKLIFEGVIAK